MYQDGSNWGKWDLHVHIPNTLLNNQYPNDSNICVMFFKKIYEEKLVVVGITDYFKIDNHIGFLEQKDNFINKSTFVDYEGIFSSEEEYKNTKDHIRNIKFFINIEFRSNDRFHKSEASSKSDYANFHLIFDDAIDIDLIKRNIDTLITTINGKQIGSLAKDDISKACVDYDLTIKKFKDLQEAQDRFMVVVVANGYGQMRENGSDQTKTDPIITKYCQNANFFFGNQDSYAKFIKSKGYNKACFISSDAHKLENIGTQYTWVKAENTFEGLKMALSEPELRISYSKDTPECKDREHYIKEIILSKKPDSSESFFLDDRKVCFNRNLNTIIGSKSSGKSLLLYLVARTFNKVKDLESKKEKNSKETDYQKILNCVEPKVIWADGYTGERPITYLSQDFISEILYVEGKYTSTLNALLDDYLKQSKLSYVKFIQSDFQKYHSYITSIKTFVQQITETNQSIIQVGDTKENINKKIQQCNDYIKLHNINIESTELEQYNNLEKQLKEVDLLILNNNKILNILPQCKDTEVNFKRSLLANLDKVEIFANEFEKLKLDLDRQWSIFIDSQISQLNLDNNEYTKKKAELIAYIDPYKKKIDSNKAVKDKFIEKTRLEKSMTELTKLETDKKTIDSKLVQIKQDLSDLFVKKYEKFDLFVNQYNDLLTKKTNDLEIGISIKAKTEPHRKLLERIFDKVNLRDSSLMKNLQTDLEDRKYDVNKFLEDIQEIINKIVEDATSNLPKKNIPLRNGHDYFSLLSDIYGIDLLEINYDITQNGKHFNQFSKGLKALIMLSLYFALDGDNYPIIIDQPENDLDNESISSKLVQFLLATKKKRQIIVATHNPIVVVNADSENVIIANENGESRENKNATEFDYKYGALENLSISEKNYLGKRTIKEHICHIMEGGEEAFKKRGITYNIKYK